MSSILPFAQELPYAIIKLDSEISNLDSFSLC